MDGSLASIFMNPATMQSWPQHDEEWSCLDSQSPEDLKYKLLCASIELQNAKAAAKADEKFQEAKLCQLQELLSIIKRERDEAREECRKLQECLSQRHSTSSANSPCSFIHSSPIVSSPSSSPWSLQELEEHLNNDNFCDFPKTPAPMELQQTLQSFSQNCNEGLQALFSIEPTCESVLEDSEQQFSLEILEQDLSFDTDPSLNLGELKQDQPELEICESSQSTRSLSRQSSSNSSSESVQMFQHRQTSKDFTEVSAPILSSATVIGTDVADTQMSAVVNYTSLPMASSNDNNVAAAMGNLPLKSRPASPLKPIFPVSAFAEGSLSVKTAPCSMQSCEGSSPMASPMAKQHANSNHVRQVHLPEPPEADPQVMLSSLPEKGKLLQAVMQAGPLLQTLLLAGPLPQWRHPPPALSTGEIPKVSMVPSKVILPYLAHVPGPLMQGHVKYHMPINNGGFSSATRVRVANADPCSRTKKLRKISPASPHQNQLMHMMSGDGMIAVGVSYPSTIY